MLKTKSIALLLFAMGLISVMAISLVFYVKEDAPSLSERVTVQANGVTEETLTIKGLTINPSEKRECVVFLTSEIESYFSTTITFEEISDSGLKPFVNVEIFLDQQSVYNGTLSQLLGGYEVCFFNELDKETSSLLKIVYEMPEETGNEAQSTIASFYIKIKIEKE